MEFINYDWLSGLMFYSAFYAIRMHTLIEIASKKMMRAMAMPNE